PANMGDCVGDLAPVSAPQHHGVATKRRLDLHLQAPPEQRHGAAPMRKPASVVQGSPDRRGAGSPLEASGSAVAANAASGASAAAGQPPKCSSRNDVERSPCRNAG